MSAPGCGFLGLVLDSAISLPVQGRARGGLLRSIEMTTTIRARGGASFAPSDVGSVEVDPKGRTVLGVDLPGLRGAGAALPGCWSDPTLRSGESWEAFREFCSLFEGRSLQILAFALLERSPVARERIELERIRSEIRGDPVPARGVDRLGDSPRGRPEVERMLSRRLGVDGVSVDDSASTWIPNPSVAMVGNRLSLDGSCALGERIRMFGARVHVRIEGISWCERPPWADGPGAMGAELEEALAELLPGGWDWNAVLRMDGVPSDANGRLGSSCGALGGAIWLGSAPPVLEIAVRSGREGRRLPHGERPS